MQRERGFSKGAKSRVVRPNRIEGETGKERLLKVVDGQLCMLMTVMD